MYTYLQTGLSFKLSLFVLFFLSNSCNDKKVFIAEKRANELIAKIAIGNPVDEFPQKYFPTEETSILLKDLREKCDFKNRVGGFIERKYIEKINEDDQILFIYKYRLKCGFVKFILTYKLGKNIELYQFTINRA